MDFNNLLKQAQADQAAAGMQEFAGFLSGYYRALLAQGIPDELAHVLVVELQRLTLTQRPTNGTP